MFGDGTKYVKTDPPAESSVDVQELQKFLDPAYSDDYWRKLTGLELDRLVRGNAFAVGNETTQLQFHSDGEYASWAHGRPLYRGVWRTVNDRILTSTHRNFVALKNRSGEVYFVPTKGDIAGLAGAPSQLETTARNRFPVGANSGPEDDIYAVTEMPDATQDNCSKLAWAGIVQIHQNKAYLTKSNGLDFVPVQVGTVTAPKVVTIGLNGDQARVSTQFKRTTTGEFSAVTSRGGCEISVTATPVDTVLPYYEQFEHNVRQSPPPFLLASELRPKMVENILTDKVLVFDYATNRNRSPLLRHFRDDGTNVLKNAFGKIVKEDWKVLSIERMVSGNTTIIAFGNRKNGPIPHFDKTPNNLGVFRMSAMADDYPYQNFWVGVLADCWPEPESPEGIRSCNEQETAKVTQEYERALSLYPFDR